METSTVAPKSSSFAGDVFKLVSGTTIAQGLMVLAAPLLARLYKPEDFGALALYLSITSIVGVIACLRYELAIMLPESDEEAANLLAVSLGFSLVVTCLTTLAIGWGGETLLGWLNAPGLKPYLWLIPVTVLLDGVFQALNYWNSRTKQFGRLSIARVTSSAATVSTQLGAGYAGYVTGGSLIGANVVGKTISTTVLGGQIWRDDRNTFWKAIRWRGMKRGVRRYKKFPIYDSWSIMFNCLSWQLPTFLLSYFFSSAIVGYYSFGLRLLQMPMSFIGQAIGQVFFQRASEFRSKGKLPELVEKSTSYLISLSLFPFLVLGILGKDFFEVLFGTRWSEAGSYVQILSAWSFFWFISSPLSTLYMVLEKQNVLLLINIQNFLTRFLSLWIGGILNNSRLAIILFSISGVFVYGALILFILKFSNLSIIKMGKTILHKFILYLPVLASLLFLKYCHIHQLVILSIAFLCATSFIIFGMKSSFISFFKHV